MNKEWQHYKRLGLGRLQVPGGWLVLIFFDGYYYRKGAMENINGNSGLCFYPDPKHEWVIER